MNWIVIMNWVRRFSKKMFSAPFARHKTLTEEVFSSGQTYHIMGRPLFPVYATDTKLCFLFYQKRNSNTKYVITFALIRSNCLFCVSISLPISIAIDFRLPTMFATCLWINRRINKHFRAKKFICKYVCYLTYFTTLG
mgnify:CR=1 FL=1